MWSRFDFWLFWNFKIVTNITNRGRLLSQKSNPATSFFMRWLECDWSRTSGSWWVYKWGLTPPSKESKVTVDSFFYATFVFSSVNWVCSFSIFISSLLYSVCLTMLYASLSILAFILSFLMIKSLWALSILFDSSIWMSSILLFV